MTKPLKVVKIGNSAGVILPKEMLERLRVEVGDELYANEASTGVTLSAYDADFAETMRIAEIVMREDRDILRALAK